MMNRRLWLPFALVGGLAVALWLSRSGAPLSSPGISSESPATTTASGLPNNGLTEMVEIQPLKSVKTVNADQSATGEPGAASATDWKQKLIVEGKLPDPVPRERIEQWLARNHTNAESLLAARQVAGGPEYLHAALAQFPNDPRVLFHALNLEDSAEARRDRLERFKAAAPDDALPEFLSAREHFKNGQPAEAMRDLLAASQKSRFQDYAAESAQAAEELYLAAGRSPAEAKGLGASSVPFPHLSQLKELARDMAGLQQQYLAAGDARSAETLAQYGLLLSQHLSGGDGSHALINQLVGYSIEQILLRQLPQDQPLEFLQGTVQDRLAEIARKKAEAKEGARRFSEFMRSATDNDWMNYFDRWKLHGEGAANNWLRQRQTAP